MARPCSIKRMACVRAHQGPSDTQHKQTETGPSYLIGPGTEVTAEHGKDESAQAQYDRLLWQMQNRPGTLSDNA